MERYRAETLITMSDRSAPAISDGVVDVTDGIIVWSGRASEAPNRPGATTHRISGILMPGMVNAHCHTPMVLLRGAGEGLPVGRWLEEVMWPREAKLTPSDVHIGMLWGASEMLGNGITTTAEMYFHSQALAEAAVEAGLRSVVTAPILEDSQLAGFGTWREQLDDLIELHRRWENHPLVEIGIGPHAAYSVSDECMRAIVDVAAGSDMLVHIHVAEQEWEDAAIRERTGMSAPAYLESLGMLEGRVLAAHAVWLSDAEIEMLARHDVAVAHCPCSNMKHASGFAPVRKMLDAAMRVAIATDGPASHHRLDLFEEMRTAVRLARVSSGNAQALTEADALWMTTAGAADAIDRPDLGRLTVGSRADMVSLGSDSSFGPVIADEYDAISRVVWSGSPAVVSNVWVDGRQVVVAGHVTSVDVAAVAAEGTLRASSLAEQGL